MGFVPNRLFKKERYRFAWQIILSMILVFFFLFFFQTQCMDVWQEGYDFCRAEFELNRTGHLPDTDIQITCYENCTIKNVTSVPRGSLNTEPNLDSENQ